MSTAKSKNSDDFLLRLISLMKITEITKAQLARELGVSNAHVANWLGGQMPRGEHLLLIAKHFNVTMEWLLSGVEAKLSGGATGGSPLYNPGMGARGLILKSEQLRKEAATFRLLAERHQAESKELIAKAEAYEEWARSLLDPEPEHPADDWDDPE